MGIKKSTVICFIGTDGSGKSTLIEETKKELARQFRIKPKVLYFGWQPYLLTTKLLSFLLKKRNYKISEKMNQKKQKFSLIQEIMLLYYLFEYISKYLFEIGIFFDKKKIILVDRYFYDMYAHYKYANKSLLFPLLLRVMPKPDYTFFLNVDIYTARKRKPEMNLELLEFHKKRYNTLARMLKLQLIMTTNPPSECVEAVVASTEKLIRRRLQ